MASIGLILRNTFVHSFSYCRIQGVPYEYKIFEYPQGTHWILQRLNECTKVFLSTSSINTMRKKSIYHPSRSSSLRYYLHKVLSSQLCRAKSLQLPWLHEFKFGNSCCQNQCRLTMTLRIGSSALYSPLSLTLDTLIAKSTLDITSNFSYRDGQPA